MQYRLVSWFLNEHDSKGFGPIVYRLRNKDSNNSVVFFFNFNIPFGGIQFESSKFQETYFLPISKFEIKLRNDKYENKGLCS